MGQARRDLLVRLCDGLQPGLEQAVRGIVRNKGASSLSPPSFLHGPRLHVGEGGPVVRVIRMWPEQAEAPAALGSVSV